MVLTCVAMHRSPMDFIMFKLVLLNLLIPVTKSLNNFRSEMKNVFGYHLAGCVNFFFHLVAYQKRRFLMFTLMVHYCDCLWLSSSIVCFLQMTFARPANNRQIKFSEIAAKTGIPINEVEILTMKAMSLGLVRGTIDQVRRRCRKIVLFKAC